MSNKQFYRHPKITHTKHTCTHEDIDTHHTASTDQCSLNQKDQSTHLENLIHESLIKLANNNSLSIICRWHCLSTLTSHLVAIWTLEQDQFSALSSVSIICG